MLGKPTKTVGSRPSGAHISLNIESVLPPCQPALIQNPSGKLVRTLTILRTMRKGSVNLVFYSFFELLVLVLLLLLVVVVVVVMVVVVVVVVVCVCVCV